MHMWTYFTSDKSNAYINWKTKNIQISKFKESNFDSKTYNVYNRHCKNGTKKNGTENINKCETNRNSLEQHSQVCHSAK